MSALIKENAVISTTDLVDLYRSVGWLAYAQDPIGLKTAIQNSSYTATAWVGSRLVGLARCLSDDVHIAYLQDILVHPEHQGQRIGKRLMDTVLKRFSHLRQFVLLTDNQPELKGFYHAFGLSDVSQRADLTAFIRLKT